MTLSEHCQSDFLKITVNNEHCPASHRAARKAIWIGEIEANDEADAIAKAAEQFNVPAAKLIAVTRG